MNPAWLKPALIGVDGAVSFGIDGEVGELLARVADGEDAARGFARSAGVLAACARAAGMLGGADQKLPAPAAPDPDALAATHAWASAIGAVFAPASQPPSHEVRLKFEACLRLSAAGRTLPAATLPSALDAGQRHAVLRPALLPVLGARGRWLAAQNPDWKYAAGAGRAGMDSDASTAWEQGSPVERLGYFRRLRAQDAGAACGLLQAGLGELGAKERLEFVRELGVGLHGHDAPLLEGLLKDRSRDVRFEAARLLALLPQTTHAQRLIGWVAPLVTRKRGLLGQGGWQVEAPEASDPGWAQAMVEATRPQHEALGERAWWLYQLARQVPLAWWTAHTGMGAAELVAWAGKSDWKAALHRGWRERVGRTEPGWIEALLGARSRDARAAANELLALLPVAQREKHWPSDIDALWKSGDAHDVLAACAPGETLSRDYSRALFPSLLACFEDDRLRHDYSLRTCLLELATLLDADAIGAVRHVSRRADETPAMAECAQAFERILHVRAVLRIPC
jgi:hypothetical protein